MLNKIPRESMEIDLSRQEMPLPEPFVAFPPAIYPEFHMQDDVFHDTGTIEEV
jgi:hypothetical protein